MLLSQIKSLLKDYNKQRSLSDLFNPPKPITLLKDFYKTCAAEGDIHREISSEERFQLYTFLWSQQFTSNSLAEKIYLILQNMELESLGLKCLYTLSIVFDTLLKSQILTPQILHLLFESRAENGLLPHIFTHISSGLWTEDNFIKIIARKDEAEDFLFILHKLQRPLLHQCTFDYLWLTPARIARIINKIFSHDAYPHFSCSENDLKFFYMHLEKFENPIIMKKLLSLNKNDLSRKTPLACMTWHAIGFDQALRKEPEGVEAYAPFPRQHYQPILFKGASYKINRESLLPEGEEIPRPNV